MVLDIALLVLTALKARKTFLSSLHSSSIVSTVQRFRLVVETNSKCPRCVSCFATNFCTWNDEHYALDSYMVALQILFHYRESPLGT